MPFTRKTRTTNSEAETRSTIPDTTAKNLSDSNQMLASVWKHTINSIYVTGLESIISGNWEEVVKEVSKILGNLDWARAALTPTSTTTPKRKMGRPAGKTRRRRKTHATETNSVDTSAH